MPATIRTWIPSLTNHKNVPPIPLQACDQQAGTYKTIVE